jgi:type IV pilus assembly protein PilW
MKCHPVKQSSKSFKERGLGLVELMVSVTVGLIIMGGVVQLFASSQQTSITAEGVSRLQENIRYAMQRVGEDIYRAGNMGCFSFAAVGSPEAGTASNGNPELQDQYIFNRLDIAGVAGTANNSWQTAIASDVVISPNNDTAWNDFESSFISGVDTVAAANPLGNAAADNPLRNGTDTLIVKYVDSASTIAIDSVPANTQLTLDNTVGLAEDDVVFAGSCRGLYVFHIDTILANTITLRGGFTHDIDSSLGFLYSGNSGAYEYSIRTGAGLVDANVCAALTPQFCSLYRSINGTAQELVIGVSDLQVSYGYEDVAAYEDDIATRGRLTVDRVQVQMTFNALDSTQPLGLLSRNITRVFAVRNQL